MIRMFKEGGVVPGRMDRLPTVAEIILVLGTPGAAERCYFRPCGGRYYSDQFACSVCVKVWDAGDHLDDPRRCETGEFWIDQLGVWITEDGWRYSGDRARGYRYPGRWDRWRLRRALRRNQRLVAVEVV